MIHILTTKDPKKGHQVKVGEYNDETKTFDRHFRPCHILRVAGNSVGLQEDIIQKLEELGCQTVRFYNVTGWIYVTEFSRWLARPSSDYGHGKQRFIALKDMTVWEPEGD